MRSIITVIHSVLTSLLITVIKLMYELSKYVGRLKFISNRSVLENNVPKYLRSVLVYETLESNDSFVQY